MNENYGERLTVKQVKNETGAVSVKKEGNNTFRITYDDGRECIRYHHTDIITKHVNGNVTLTSGGWMTPTTKERMVYLRQFAPGFSIYQSNKVWYLSKVNWSDTDRKEWTFQDGITIDPNGNVTGEGDDPKALLKLDRRIKLYVKGYMGKLLKREIGSPSGGDCWYCHMKNPDGLSFGELSHNTDHIISHFDEKYYVPSLLVNAIRAFPVSMIAESELGYLTKQHEQSANEWGADIVKSQVSKSLTRYLRRQLGLAA